jgi:hypothetical protein
MKPWPTGEAEGASTAGAASARDTGTTATSAFGASLLLRASLALALSFIFIIMLIDGLEGAAFASTGAGATAARDWNLIGEAIIGAGADTAAV